ncbi:MAG: hypothetical protein O2954_17860 [bacterium]|nr:hypothetical protein [bacterium]
MQVRAIEFQENFARVPVEGARQQSLLMREPELARQQVARVAANEQLLNLSRPTPMAETEGAIVEPDDRRTTERRSNRGTARQVRQEKEEKRNRPGADGVSGTRIDIVV